MEVDFGCLQAGVSEDCLDDDDVVLLVFQGVACEAVAESMWCDSGDSEGPHVIDQFLEVLFGGSC